MIDGAWCWREVSEATPTPFKVLDAGDESTIAALREALGENDFDAAWAEGRRCRS
jgi:hypothetical protein